MENDSWDIYSYFSLISEADRAESFTSFRNYEGSWLWSIATWSFQESEFQWNRRIIKRAISRAARGMRVALCYCAGESTEDELDVHQSADCRKSKVVKCFWHKRYSFLLATIYTNTKKKQRSSGYSYVRKLIVLCSVFNSNRNSSFEIS